MKNRIKGFTLIELLAVIVILGLLMAIAIPSVTKYITESRKKTVVSTIGNYITAMVNEVNDLTYTFTGTNTIYAVPIECISLERGGTNPFGAWHQANNAYWAYVLLQYNDQTSSYTYGYTFKDSAGYGLYPTSHSKLNEQGKQIQTGLDLKRPTGGKVTTITELKNWNGFVVNDTTNLVVLEAESEGNTGDGKTTCTLQQKGDNYTSVEEKKNKDTTPPVVNNHYSSPGDASIYFEVNLSSLTEDDYPITVDYYIKEETESNYYLAKSIIMNSGTSTSYTYDLLSERRFYDLKVVITDKAGNKSEVIDGSYTYCFLAGTKVLTENGLKNIEDIKLGEKVYSLNMDTNKRELKKVTALIRSKTDEVYELTIGEEVVKASPRHEFYIVDKGWIRAYELEEGDVLVSTSNGDMEIKKIEHKYLKEEVPTYNLTVDENHNYLITEYRLLVHNASSPA